MGTAVTSRFVAKMLFRLPEAANVIENPSADEVKALAAQDAEREADAATGT